MTWFQLTLSSSLEVCWIWKHFSRHIFVHHAERKKKTAKSCFCVCGNPILRKSGCWLIYCCLPVRKMNPHIFKSIWKLGVTSDSCISWFTKKYISYLIHPLASTPQLLLSLVYPNPLEGLHKPLVCLFLYQICPFYERSMAYLEKQQNMYISTTKLLQNKKGI